MFFHFVFLFFFAGKRLGADQGLVVVGPGGQAVDRDAGRTEHTADYAFRVGRLQGRGLPGRGHHAVVHRRHQRLQRVYQGA